MDGATSSDNKKGRKKAKEGFCFILGGYPRSWLIKGYWMVGQLYLVRGVYCYRINSLRAGDLGSSKDTRRQPTAKDARVLPDWSFPAGSSGLPR